MSLAGGVSMLEWGVSIRRNRGSVWPGINIDVELQSAVEPKSPLGKALSYANQQWHKLIRILDHENTELDNNLIEYKIRPLALGRKNYLFAGSHDAAQRIAMMYSFFGSCKAQNINPYEWLKSTLERIPETKLSELETLLPGYRCSWPEAYYASPLARCRSCIAAQNESLTSSE